MCEGIGMFEFGLQGLGGTQVSATAWASRPISAE